VTNDDNVAFDADPKDSAIDTAIAFAKMWDSAGEVGWKITGPGHGFTLVDEDDWQGAVASAPLSHLGFHAPLLMTDNADKLPPQRDAYYTSVAPTYLTSLVDGPHNVHYISEMNNRRLWNTNTGSRHTDSQPPPHATRSTRPGGRRVASDRDDGRC
jgi:hypothetical protein